MIISVCGPVGFETAEKLYNDNREMLSDRFPEFFLRQFRSIKDDLVAGEPEGECLLIEIGANGIYGALWQAGEILGCGMKVFTRAIPVRQEVIEILELFGESPYECPSDGSILIITDREKKNVTIGGKTFSLTMIGITTSDNARILEDIDSVRFLTPPSRQEKDILARNEDNSGKR